MPEATRRKLPARALEPVLPGLQDRPVVACATGSIFGVPKSPVEGLCRRVRDGRGGRKRGARRDIRPCSPGYTSHVGGSVRTWPASIA